MSAVIGTFLTVCPGALAGPAKGGSVMPHYLVGGDVYDGGSCHLSGTVGIDATPDVLGAYRVTLICKVTKRPVRQMWSGSDGAYAFTSIRPGPWIVLAEDHTGTYNAVVADNELAVAM